MSDKKNIVSYEEQIEMGLVRPPRPSNFVAPLRGDVLPPVRSVPNVIDPYAQAMPVAVQQVAKYEATPITRAHAMRMKIRDITLFLGLMTGAAMFVFQLYPSTWQTFTVIMLWLLAVTVEGLATFLALAVLDYRETPAAMNRMQWGDYAKLMFNEQSHRLRAQYPEQYDAKGRRK